MCDFPPPASARASDEDTLRPPFRALACLVGAFASPTTCRGADGPGVAPGAGTAWSPPPPRRPRRSAATPRAGHSSDLQKVGRVRPQTTSSTWRCGTTPTPARWSAARARRPISAAAGAYYRHFAQNRPPREGLRPWAGSHLPLTTTNPSVVLNYCCSISAAGSRRSRRPAGPVPPTGRTTAIQDASSRRAGVLPVLERAALEGAQLVP